MGKIQKDSLGDRQKQYERAQEHYLVPKMPFIVRVDGKAFHTYTRGFKKPFDEVMGNAMKRTMKSLCEDIPGAVFGYTQSDEITVVCKYTDRIKSQAWFGGRVEKIVAITASKATKYFNKYFEDEVTAFISEGEALSLAQYTYNKEKMAKHLKAIDKGAEFDSRVFNIPEWDCINNIIWRQQDAIRNSVEAVGQANFSAKELNKVNVVQIREKLLNEKSISWEYDFTPYQKYGACCYREYVDKVVRGNTITRTLWVVDEWRVIQSDREWFSRITTLLED